jgi:hypothetical protein
MKQRIEELKRVKSKTTTETEINGVRVINNVEDNRLQIFFDCKPPAEIRAKLKSRGFRWSPRNKAWQRKLSSSAESAAKSILRDLEASN